MMPARTAAQNGCSRRFALSWPSARRKNAPAPALTNIRPAVETCWTPKITGYDFGDNHADTFRVEDGILKVRYDKYKDGQFGGKFGHLFYKDKFSHYRLRVEYRFVGEQCKGGPEWAIRNSGVSVMFAPVSPGKSAARGLAWRQDQRAPGARLE